MNRAITLLLSLLLLLPLTAAAVEMNGLYWVELSVSDRTEAVRNRAALEGLRQVLMRVSGRRELPAALPAPEQVSAALQEYRYSEVAAAAVETALPDTSETATSAAAVTPPAVGNISESAALPETLPVLMLQLRFDPQVVAQMLTDSGLPVWGSMRPRTLLWLVLEQGSERQLLLTGSDHLAEQLAIKQAQQRGLPLQLPQQSDGVSSSDLWGGFFEQMLQVSQQQQAQAVLVGRLYRDSDSRWQGRWDLYLGREQWHWEAPPSASGGEVVIAGVDNSVDRLAAHYLQPTTRVVSHESRAGEGTALRLLLLDITDLVALQRALDHLQGLQGVEAVVIESLAGSRALLALQGNGSAAVWQQTLALGDTLQPVGEAGLDAMMSYRLLP